MTHNPETKFVTTETLNRYIKTRTYKCFPRDSMLTGARPFCVNCTAHNKSVHSTTGIGLVDMNQSSIYATCKRLLRTHAKKPIGNAELKSGDVVHTRKGNLNLINVTIYIFDGNISRDDSYRPKSRASVWTIRFRRSTNRRQVFQL
jgi:hypothetical protein